STGYALQSVAPGAFAPSLSRYQPACGLQKVWFTCASPCSAMLPNDARSATRVAWDGNGSASATRARSRPTATRYALPMATLEDTELGRQIVEEAKRYVLHSWSVQSLVNPIPVAGAEGRYFWDYDGKRYLDFASQL